MSAQVLTFLFFYRLCGSAMSAVYPSEEPEDEENPNSVIDKIIDKVIGDGEPEDDLEE